MPTLITRPNAFSSRVVRVEAPAGECLAELIVRGMEAAGEPVEHARYACVTVDERKIDKDRWLEVVPPAEATVVVNALPAGDFGPLFVQLVGIGLNFLVPGSGWAAFAIKAAITVGTSLIAQAIAPSPRQSLTGQREPPTPASYSITGVRNEARPYGSIPMVYGRLVNFHPPLAAVPYTDANNAYGDQYLHMVFGWMGECTVSDLKVGDTSIASLRNVTTETRQGAAGDAALTLYPSQVRDQALNIQLRQANGYTYRSTEPDTDEIVIEVLFPGGMGRITDRNEKLGIRVAFSVVYFGSGFSGYTAAPIVADNQYSVYVEGAGQFSVQGYTKAAVRRSVRFRVTRGQYSVGIARITVDDQSDTSGDNQSTTFEDSYLVSVRSIRYETPLTETGLALVAVRAQANEQLNGVIDNFNCTVQRLLPVWNGATWSSPQSTRNPAWAFCDVLRGAGNARPLDDDRIDLDTILAWAQACDSAGLTFDGVLAERSSVWEVLQEIAATGFASPTVRDGKFSVIHDTTRDTPVQHFSPRNSWGLRVQRLFGDLPHALVVRFPNAATLHQADEITVYDDGYTAETATRFETLDLPFTTSASLAWKAGRRYLATARLRPRIISIETDFEFLICERGDLIRVSHDVMLVGLGAARVASLTTDGGGNLTDVTLDAPFTMASASYGLRFRRATGATLLVAVDTVPGDTATFTLTTPITSGDPMPAVGDLAFFGEYGSESIECLVRSIEPRADLTATLTLVDYAPAIFTADTSAIPDFDPGITLRPTTQRRAPATPIVLSVDSDERALARLPDGTFVPRVLIAYELRPTEAHLPADSIQIRWRSTIEAGDPQYRLVPVQTGLVALEPVDEGETLIIELRTVSTAGATSEWVGVTHTVIGRTTLPPDVERLYRAGDVLIWPYDNPPRDLAGFLVRAHYGTATTWSTARALHPGVWPGPPFPIADLAGTQVVLVKAIDTAGNESATPATVTLALGDVIVDNVVVTQTEAPGFAGTLTNGTDTGTQIEADVLSSPPAWDDPSGPAWLPTGDQAYGTTVYAAMTYIAAYTPSASYLGDGVLKLETTVTGEYTLDYRISTSEAAYPSPTGDPAFDPLGDPAYGTPTVTAWTPWPGVLGPFETDDETYEIRLTTREGTTQGVCSQLDLITDLPDVVEVLEDVVIAAASTRLPITKTFRAITAVQLTVQDDSGTGITARILDKDETLGPDVEVLDASGTAVDGLVDAIIQGY